jgi:hypothetical protein
MSQSSYVKRAKKVRPSKWKPKKVSAMIKKDIKVKSMKGLLHRKLKQREKRLQRRLQRQQQN